MNVRSGDQIVTQVPPLDLIQLARIESMHQGFLYQHLYTVACLLRAQSLGATTVIVDRDEDLEMVFPDRQIYIQVKTRSDPLTPSDISSAISRFELLKAEHDAGRRPGAASFVIVSNIHPGPTLLNRENGAFSECHFSIMWPSGSENTELPESWNDIPTAFEYCTELAATLPFALLAPETLIWKLAACVMGAAAGVHPHSDHTFKVSDLPTLFEQLVVQTQDFPAPPAVYRCHEAEPSLKSEARVRIVSGYSGSGKTAWVSQVAAQSSEVMAYFDVTETPGPTVAASIARDLAARLFGKTKGGLGKIVLPGATGPEILHRIGATLAEQAQVATIVLDNAHRVPPADIQTFVEHGRSLRFILLCQPGKSVQEMEARLSILAEPLRGWSVDTIAAEVAARKCQGDYRACQRLGSLTGSMPLYVQNAIAIATREYSASIAKLCDDVEAQTHSTQTAQELILAQVFEGFPEAVRDGIGVLSLSDILLSRTESISLLVSALSVDQSAAAKLLRQIRGTGCMEIFGCDLLKIHDAIRLLGNSHLDASGQDLASRSRGALKELLIVSLRQDWGLPKLSLLLRMLAATGSVKTLVDFVTDEVFHELGAQPALIEFLERAVSSQTLGADDRFWANDGLAFAYIKHGDYINASMRLDEMSALIPQHQLGKRHRLAYWMKRMNFQAVSGDLTGVQAAIEEVISQLPDDPKHLRIFRYNAANALFSLKQYQAVADEALDLISEYYEVLGIEPGQVFGKNPNDIRPLLRSNEDLTDDLKHLADCLDLHAHAADALGVTAPFNRIHAMKFYTLARAFDSLIRIGQDLVDEYVGRSDFIGARQLIEENLLPNVLALKLLSRIVPVRSQYAVVLAMCGEFDAADAEMERLAPYESGLDEKGQWELRNQRKGIAKLRREGPPRQWHPMKHDTEASPLPKVGRNDLCPCGSGRKFKKCHGPRS